MNSCDNDFQREAEIMKLLKHPNILGCFGDGVVDNNFIILMEWMPGVSVNIVVTISAFVNFFSV